MSRRYFAFLKLSSARITPLICTILAFFLHNLEGALQWERTQVNYSAGWDEFELKFSFPFVNKNSDAVEIKRLSTSCGCTEIKPLAKTVLSPGERGVLKAVYRAKNRSGPQFETLYVETNEPKDNIYQLRLSIELPVVAEMKPGVLFWEKDGQPQAKTMQVRWNGPQKAVLQVIQGAPPGWKVSVKETTAGKIWQVQVTPGSTHQEKMVQLPLVFRANGQSRATEALAIVQATR
ncbi:MAG: DUF1573 domain-containing protein [Verrucomicrobiota bacterium]